MSFLQESVSSIHIIPNDYEIDLPISKNPVFYIIEHELLSCYTDKYFGCPILEFAIYNKTYIGKLKNLLQKHYCR